MSKIYAIVENGIVVDYGLSSIVVSNRIGIKNKIVEYVKTSPLGEMTNYNYKTEIMPVFDTDGLLYQQWSVQFYNIEVIKEKLGQKFADNTTKHIEKYYNDLKQRSDIVDKEVYQITLLHNTQYTLEYIQKECVKYASLVIDGTETIENLISPYSELERIKWEQLIKAYIRVIWLMSCKDIYRVRMNEINLLESVDGISDVDVPLVFPPYPLPSSTIILEDINPMGAFNSLFNR